MHVRRLFRLFLLAAALPMTATARSPKQCAPVADATQLLNKDVCISAHIYDVVELGDGTRFLDVCSPQIPDSACRFTIVSFQQDRKEVGTLDSYRGSDVQIRGIVESMRGRAGIVLSHVRQFHGGPPRFRPNPLLTRGFDAEQERPPLSDPNLRSHSVRRAFMNTRDLEPARP